MVGGSGRAEQIVDELGALGVVVRQVTSPEAVTDPTTIGLLDLAALDGFELSAAAAVDRAQATLELARAVDARPEQIGVVVVTSIDGRHGFAGGELVADAPIQATGVGFWKGAAKEWRRHRVRCVDVASTVDASVIARHVAAELAGAIPGDELEHGIDSEGLWAIRLESHAVSGDTELAADAVVLAVGGAQGIGADILAGAVGAPGRTIVIAGRTDPAVTDESAALAAATTESEIRDVLIAEVRAAGDRPKPAEIERSLRRLLSARRVRATVSQLTNLGAKVEYHPLDGRDAVALVALVDSTMERYGRLDLVVHAAGVIADAPVARKDDESMERVLATKVAPALALCDAVPGDTTVLFFGSVAGRLGNASQADYGAANEFLAKLAASRRSAGADVRCLAWGPWDSGMVSSGLIAAYDALGIVPIAVAAGVEAFARELTDSPGRAEVVLANSTDVMAGLRWPPSAATILGS